jgi:hypothetical protein
MFIMQTQQEREPTLIKSRIDIRRMNNITGEFHDNKRIYST